MAGLALLAPLGAGIAVLVDPISRKKKSGEKWIRVAAIDQVVADGVPRKFKVIIDEPWDKWSLYEPQPVGEVYLRRETEDQTPVAFSTKCPHMGCIFDYRPSTDDFFCPCHKGIFGCDGAQKSEVSPRDLDSLDVKVENGDVLVNYKRFKPGVKDRIEVL